MGTRKQATIFFNATTAAAAASSSSSSNHDASSSNSTTSSHSPHNTSVVDDLSDCNAATITSVEELNSSLFGISLAVPEWEALLTVFILTIIIVLTIIGNILVILSVFTYKPLRIVQNFFIVSLAVADLTVALLVLPFNVAYLILGRWEFGITMCKLWLTCDVMCCTSSILNLCVIALDRYWAITDPINYAQKRTLNRVMLLIAGVWVLSFLISSPPLVGWNDWPEEFTSATPCELNSDRGYVIYSSLGSFFIPLVIMTIVYLEIFIATRRRLRDRARASKINTMAMSCQSVTTNTMRASIDHAHERRWTQNFLICCSATKSTSNIKTKTSSTKTNASKKLKKTHAVVMQEVDLESISSETHVNIENPSDEKLKLQATDLQDILTDVNDPRKSEIKKSIENELVIEGGNESSAKSTTGDGVVEVIEVLVAKKKSRRPKIKDSIRQARRQMPERRANKTAELASSMKAVKSKNGKMLDNLIHAKSQEEQQMEHKHDSIKRVFNRKKNSIEIFVEGDEGTSVYDNDEENESLKTSPPHSSSGGQVATSMSVPLQKKSPGGLYQIIEERQKISLSKERRAARTLGIIMGIFVICWLPFSIMYVVLPFCESCCPTNKFKNFITWLGYVNSGLNPVIYTIFNLDYRRAFKRLLNIK